MLLPWHEVSGMVRLSLPLGLRPASLCAGLDIGRDSLRLALLRRRGGRRQVLQLATRRLPSPGAGRDHFSDIDALASHCRALLAAPACRDATLVLAIPAASLTHRQLVLPAGSNAVQRLSQVRAEMAAHGLAAEEYELDYQLQGPQPGSPGDVQVLALAAPTLAIEDRLALAEALQMPLAALPPEDLCLRDFLRQDRPTRAAAVLRLDSGSRWLIQGTGASQPLHCPAAAVGKSRADAALALLAELAPLLHQRTHQLLLTGDQPGLDDLPRLFHRYTSLTAAPARLPASLVLATASGDTTPSALSGFHLALALAARGLA
ncbi:pilus assembly protein PilM [Herbaspirillum sp. NPDC087042]|uniref:pilus assembly protein PilM n=1 Tax=Herbaspirillum sp. NPDC087042 TaxID=3364004 RepID=UPI00380A148D